jgi:hypothetical protein
MNIQQNETSKENKTTFGKEMGESSVKIGLDAHFNPSVVIFDDTSAVVKFKHIRIAVVLPLELVVIISLFLYLQQVMAIICAFTHQFVVSAAIFELLLHLKVKLELQFFEAVLQLQAAAVQPLFMNLTLECCAVLIS